MENGAAKAIIFDATPTDAGPQSDIRYWVHVEKPGGGIITFERVASIDRSVPETVSCFPAKIGSTHPAYISNGIVSLWIAPIPATIDCEDIE